MPRKRLDATARRSDIVKAAMPLFAREGFAGTTTRQIARAAGVSEALLYRHFPNKEALYQEIWALGYQVAERFSRLLGTSEPSTASLVQGVHLVMLLFSDGPAGHPVGAEGGAKPEDLFRLMLNSFMEDGEFARLALQAVLAGPLVEFEANHQAALASGDLAPGAVTARNGFWFIHKTALMTAATRLPEVPVTLHTDDDTEVLRQAVVFALRGLGMTETAIAAHYSPEALNREVRLAMAPRP